MTAEELIEELKKHPPESIIMISDPSENAYAAGEVIKGNAYIHDDSPDCDEEDGREVPAIYIQAVWEH